MSHENSNDKGFTWWLVWAWLGLTLGNLLAFAQLAELPEAALILVGLNTVLMVLVLQYNKYAFLIATVLTLNPIVWLINGIYLKRRWNHPRVNKGSVGTDSVAAY